MQKSIPPPPPRKRTIHPYITFAIDIKNFYTYRDFLKRKPKKTQQFKFSIINAYQLRYPKQIQLKLLKILKITKPLIKVDLKEFTITGWNIWNAGLLSTWKKVSHIKTLSLTMMSPKRCFRYFPSLEVLSYQLNGPSSIMLDIYPHSQIVVPENYLKSLKYCPKIRSLRIQDFTTNITRPFRTGFENRRYLRSLDSLTLRNEGPVDLNFPIEFCESLKSISIRLSDSCLCEVSPQILSALPKLPYLREISLRIPFSQTLNLGDVIQKLAKRGVLEKVSLELVLDIQNLELILDALELCRLTHFSLRTRAQGNLLKSLSDFLQNTDSLEYLSLKISNSHFHSKDLIEMCNQINKLQALKYLKLKDVKTSKFARINCFIPHLSGVFQKQIKMETFHLVCDQLPASESLEKLGRVLGTSTPFLTHLRIDFATLPYTKKTYQSLLPLVKNLSRIQVLKIPCLAINHSSSQFFIEMAEALHGCTYLREFVIGEIKETAIVSDVFTALEIILSKRGLRKFVSLLSESFQKALSKEKDIKFPNLKKIIEKNPYLDSISLKNNLNWLILRDQQCMFSL